MKSHDLVAGDHMTIQVPQGSCCRDAIVTRRVSSSLNTRACEAPGFGHVGALEETITLSGSCLAAPVTVCTVTCHLCVYPSHRESPVLECEAPGSWLCDQGERLRPWYCRGTDPTGLG